MPSPIPRPLHVLTLVSALAGALAASASPALSQLSTTRGWSFGAHLQGTSLTPEGGTNSSGGGLGIRAGYGFNRIVTGFVHVDGSQIDITEGGSIVGSWNLAHAELGARFHFANSLRRWVPYLETSVGARAVEVRDAEFAGESAGNVTFNGGAFTVGTGLSTYFKPSLAFDVSLKWTGGKFTEIDLGDIVQRNIDIDAASFRFGLGLIWWP
ncbi:MAG: outer membrane beta-barrel protein [Gemmatimonadetes bacterium]|nr:outer membrane beta-barrel protein [Gemmatimonadota bacterium]MCC6771440.1 outer membrane beta-barrel protein [Gemmatimonadaceae bacterium]